MWEKLALPIFDIVPMTTVFLTPALSMFIGVGSYSKETTQLPNEAKRPKGITIAWREGPFPSFWLGFTFIVIFFI